MDPHTTLDQNAPTTQTRPRGRRLAAAAAGAALVVTMGALPAQAQNAGAAPAETRSADSEPSDTLMPWTEEHGNRIGSIDRHVTQMSDLVFWAGYNFGAEDVKLSAVAVDETGRVIGEAVDVPFEFRDEINGGRIDAEKARQVLGDGAHGHVLLQVAASGFYVAKAHLGPDEDLSDGQVEVLDLISEGGMHLKDTPVKWTSKVYMTPGTVGFQSGWSYDSSQGDAVVTVVDEPDHGDVMVDAGGSGDASAGMIDVQYFPEEGYTGGDGFTVRYEAEGKVREQTYQVAWDGQVVEELTAGDPMVPGVLGAAALLDRPTEPADPTDPGQPGDDEQGDDSDEHTVPDKVETGGEGNLAMGATAAFGATALIGAALFGRRRTAEH